MTKMNGKKQDFDSETLSINLDCLKGTARKLAETVLIHADYEYEGFKWLCSTFGNIAQHLGVSEKTIRRIASKPPFHYITRYTPEDGKHILLKLGVAPCETDYVFRLRAVWVRGLAYFNEAAIQEWPMEVMKAKYFGLPYDRLLKRIEKAKEWEPVLEKLKAGKRISLNVKPHEIGLLRECIRQLDDDVFDTVAFLASWNGWHSFTSYLKAAEREGYFYHWPTLGPIARNPDIALQAYLDALQEQGNISIAESARLNAKIAKLTPPT